MEWEQLEYFSKVAQLEHMTKAAQELYISQPTLSLAIRRLEDELGVPLFERKGRNIYLNTYGRLFYSHVEPALEHLRKAKQALAEQKKADESVINIVSPSLYAFPGLMDRIYQIAPNIVINHIARTTPGNLIHMLQNREIDFCITMLDLSGSDVESHYLGKQRLFVCMSKQNPLAKKSKIHLDEIRNAEFAMDSSEAGISAKIIEICQHVGFTPKVSFSAKTAQDQMQSLVSRNYVTIVPLVDADSPRRPDVVAVELDRSDYEAALHLYRAINVKEKPVVSAVINMIRDYFDSEYV